MPAGWQKPTRPETSSRVRVMLGDRGVADARVHTSVLPEFVRRYNETRPSQASSSNVSSPPT